MDYFVQVSDIRHLLQELDVAKAVVMGHSMGGKAAMVLALCHPELVEKLILVDSSPTQSSSPPGEMQNYITAMRQMNLDIVKSKKDAEKQLTESVPVSTGEMVKKLISLLGVKTPSLLSNQFDCPISVCRYISRERCAVTFCMWTPGFREMFLKCSFIPLSTESTCEVIFTHKPHA